jgi:hypothetical protein
VDQTTHLCVPAAKKSTAKLLGYQMIANTNNYEPHRRNNLSARTHARAENQFVHMAFLNDVSPISFIGNFLPQWRECNPRGDSIHVVVGRNGISLATGLHHFQKWMH